MPLEYICLFNLHKEDLQSGVTEKRKENTEKGENIKGKRTKGKCSVMKGRIQMLINNAGFTLAYELLF